MTTIDTPRRGRPPKFGRPSQPVTITLPEDVVAAFRAVDPDLSRAIVHVAGASAPRLTPRPAVELTHYGHSAVIVLTPSKAVERLPGVAFVPLPDGRALISLDKDKSVAEFEVMVRDALDNARTSSADRETLQRLGDILRYARRSRRVRVSQRNIIVLETTTRRPATTPRRSGRPQEAKGEMDR